VWGTAILAYPAAGDLKLLHDFAQRQLLAPIQRLRLANFEGVISTRAAQGQLRSRTRVGTRKSSDCARWEIGLGRFSKAEIDDGPKHV